MRFLVFLSTLSLRRATRVGALAFPAHFIFYPRSPCGERPRSYCNSAGYCVFLSTLSLRRATSYAEFMTWGANFLSTLSLRRATTNVELHDWPPVRFSIHALLAESDMGSAYLIVLRLTFLSTLSLRRATLATWKPDYICRVFYPRSPCGERRTWRKVNPNPKIFLSTLSLRRATPQAIYPSSTPPFSIHALLAESDWFSGRSAARW